jgi:hypothetical protein
MMGVSKIGMIGAAAVLGGGLLGGTVYMYQVDSEKIATLAVQQNSVSMALARRDMLVAAQRDALDKSGRADLGEQRSRLAVQAAELAEQTAKIAQLQTELAAMEAQAQTISAQADRDDLFRTSLEAYAGAGFKTYYGYYGDLAKDGRTTTISKETYRLKLSAQSPRVSGLISGPVEYLGKTVQRTWAVEGFLRNPELTLGILAVPNKDDPKPPTGVGTYYLAKTGEDYSGTAIYLDCVHRYVQCPYALANVDLSEDQARSRWPELFKRACEKIDLTPGFEAPPLTC